jgi:tetratricopeptide (TPR) repeat protein
MTQKPDGKSIKGKKVVSLDGTSVAGDFHLTINGKDSDSSQVSEPASNLESEFFPDREAGKRPVACLIPYSRNLNFQDREPSVDDLRKALREEGSALVQAVHGQGGVGKTQLASEYVYCTAIDETDYDVAWWLDCGLTDDDRSPHPTGEPPALAAGYVALAAKLPLPDSVKNADDPQEIIDAVRGWLEMHDGWLLVFDNVVEEAHLRPYLPQASRGHVIITSRSSHWSSSVASLQVRPFEPDLARDFLLELSGSEDAAAAEALAEELGCLPLALAQAGHYVRETHGSLSRYLQDFQANRKKALKRKSTLDAYEKTIFDTFDLSIKAVQKRSKPAADLMSLCSFFARRDIPLSLLEARPTVLPKSLQSTVRNSDKLSDALRTLKQFGLVDIQDEALSLHTLVHFIACERQTKTQKARWIEAAVRLIDASLSADLQTDLSTWPIYERLSPHAVTAVDHADPDGAEDADMPARHSPSRPEVVQEESNRADERESSESESAIAAAVVPRGIASEATGRLCSKIGVYRNLRAQFSQAEPLYRRALSIGEQSLGPDHPEVAIRLSNLAQLLQDTNRLSEAEPMMRRALSIGEQSYGPDHPNVAIRLNNLAQLLKATNRLSEAEPLMRRALSIFHSSLGEDHPSTQRVAANYESLQEARDKG